AFAKEGMQVAKPTKLALVALAALLLTSVATVVMLVLPGSASAPRQDFAAPAAASKSPGARVVPEASAAHVVAAVTDAAGPIADAIVRCAPTHGEVIVAHTARDGTASVDLAAGEWSIAASADGREPSAMSFL